MFYDYMIQTIENIKQCISGCDKRVLYVLSQPDIV